MSRRLEKSRESVAAPPAGGDASDAESHGEGLIGLAMPTEMAMVAKELRLLLEALGKAREGLAGREASLSAREQALHQREMALGAREASLVERERSFESCPSPVRSTPDLERREAALEGLRRELLQKEKQLQQRADEVAILEAAAEEAMSLATEAMEAPQQFKAGRSQLGGPACSDGALLEGPPVPPVAATAPRHVESNALAEAAKDAEILARATKLAEDRRRTEEDRRRADEAHRLEEEAQTLLALVKTIPMLSQVGERVQKVVQSGDLTQTALFAFYAMCVSLLREDILNRMRSVARSEAEAAQKLADAEARNEIMKEDFNRYRSRVKSEQEAFSARATEELLRMLVPVADNFTRALAVASVNHDAFRDGVRMIHRQLGDVLTDAGLVPIKCEGDRFDPHIHEALMRVETDEFPEDTVCEEVQRGYHLAGKVFRPALVKVARAPVKSAVADPAPLAKQEASQSLASPVTEAVQESQVP